MRTHRQHNPHNDIPHTVRQSVSQTDKHENGEPENAHTTHTQTQITTTMTMTSDVRQEDLMVNSAVIHLFIMYFIPISTKFGADIEA